jgi:phosphoenolpyruvate-protein phosphotransferase (PTS system enzyme I)
LAQKSKIIVVELNEQNYELDFKAQIKLRGIPSSHGMAHAPAYVLRPEKAIATEEKISPDQVDSELERFEKAINSLIEEFQLILDKIDTDSRNVAAVIETNIIILSDPFLLQSIQKKIKDCKSAECAIVEEFSGQIHMLRQAKDAILRERAQELDQIKVRLLGILHHSEIDYSKAGDKIVVAQSISPSDLINFSEFGVLGYIIEVGGIASHTSILARTFNIPAVIGVKDATGLIHNDVPVVLDAYGGVIYANPEDEIIVDYNEKKKEEEQHKIQLGELLDLKSETLDGKEIKLRANADFEHEAEAALMAGAEGIGLLRSENLILKLNHFPNEDEQFKWYESIAQRMYPHQVTIRAFDVGTDKYAVGSPQHEANPALGFRGIRFLLQRQDVFVTQIRAVLRASRNKNVRLMLPMVSMHNELLTSQRLIEQCKKQLEDEKVDFNPQIPVGIMIETPAAAVQSDFLAQYCDFFSIGTNDLTQYILAVDRTNDLVSEMYEPFNPAVLYLIKMAVDSAIRHNISVSVCGELAGHSAATGLLVGMGVSELSVVPSMILELKKKIRENTFEEAKQIADDILSLRNFQEIKSYLSI